MIKPEEIPQFTGDLELLEKAYGNLKTDAGHIRSTGQDVHTKFQGLSAYYRAPEAEQLFASTKPVKDRADTFATGLESVSGALSGYATEIRPLVKKLEDLKDEATTFVDSVKDDDDWQYDGDKVDRHNRIRDEITRTVAAFWAAERTCHNKITALFHGTQMVTGDGSDRKDQYGFDADDLKNAKLPWGDPVEEKHHWYEVGHWVKSFVWDGLIVDGVWGTIKGLGTLVGFGGWEAMGQAWKGLAQLATGLVLTSLPGLGTLFWALPDDKLPSWIRDSRTAMKETGKALVAWDEWGKNPARAAGAVTFNVLTTVFTGGAGGAASGAGKAGAVAKALSVAGKAGRVIDPMTYVAKGAGAGLSKIGDITKALKGIGKIDIPALPENAITLPKDALRLPDGSFHLPEGTPIPEGATKLPNGTFKLPDDVPVVHDGAHPLPTPEDTGPLYGHPDGHIVDGNGKILIHADELHKPPATGAGTGPAGSDLPRTPSPAREPALVGTAPHTATETAAHTGEHLHLGNSLDTDHGDLGRTGNHTPTTPTIHAGSDHLPVVSNSVDHLPSTYPGDGVHAPGHDLPRGHHQETVHPQSHDGPVGGKQEAPPFRSERPGEPASGDHSPAGDDHTPPGEHGTHEPRHEGQEHPNGHGDEHGHGQEGDDPAAGSPDEPVHDADDHTPAHESAHEKDGNPYSGHEPDYSRPALLSGDGPLTLRDVRNERVVRNRWEMGEEYHRQLWHGDPERHYPVPTNTDPKYPVTATGGRKVDVPVDLPDGRTVAVEVKTYGQYRTITLKDGTHETIKNEVPLSKHIKEQIHKDVALRRMNPGYDPRWSFTHAGPSDELRNYLKKAKIIFLEYGPAPKKDQWDLPAKKK
ncbi:hypothetical protein [Streptomyces sp. SAT1]|uniref:hypothetical protein n=1 Tax=Streptomyces sp. SAT1 TaxID=1849967 RepID=UPI000A903EC1|nr:hypothetical protein [Streptomyces sp. SAT1]